MWGATCHTPLGSVLDLVRQSPIENRQSNIPCACLPVIDRNPEVVEKALMNKL
jgi:hypothetical protein